MLLVCRSPFKERKPLTVGKEIEKIRNREKKEKQVCKRKGWRKDKWNTRTTKGCNLSVTGWYLRAGPIVARKLLLLPFKCLSWGAVKHGISFLQLQAGGETDCWYEVSHKPVSIMCVAVLTNVSCDDRIRMLSYRYNECLGKAEQSWYSKIHGQVLCSHKPPHVEEMAHHKFGLYYFHIRSFYLYFSVRENDVFFVKISSFIRAAASCFFSIFLLRNMI